MHDSKETYQKLLRQGHDSGTAARLAMQAERTKRSKRSASFERGL